MILLLLLNPCNSKFNTWDHQPRPLTHIQTGMSFFEEDIHNSLHWVKEEQMDTILKKVMHYSFSNPEQGYRFMNTVTSGSLRGVLEGVGIRKKLKLVMALFEGIFKAIKESFSKLVSSIFMKLEGLKDMNNPELSDFRGGMNDLEEFMVGISAGVSVRTIATQQESLEHLFKIIGKGMVEVDSDVTYPIVKLAGYHLTRNIIERPMIGIRMIAAATNAVFSIIIDKLFKALKSLYRYLSPIFNSMSAKIIKYFDIISDLLSKIADKLGQTVNYVFNDFSSQSHPSSEEEEVAETILLETIGFVDSLDSISLTA